MTEPQWTNGHGQPDADPLPDGEHVDVDGISDAEDELHGPEPDPAEKSKRMTQGERLREAVDEAGVELFHDTEFRAYAAFEQEGHRETWAVRSSGFRRYVSWLMYKQSGKAPRAADMADFIGTIEGQAQFEGQLRPVSVRIGATDDGLAIDLGDAAWSAIEIDADGWHHVGRSRIHFIRPRGMLALPVPESGGSIDELRPFLNVADDDAWRLMIGALVMMFRPAGPYPVVGIHGEQGAAKSTAMRVLRKLIDPRETMDRAAPRNDHDLAIHAMHNHVVALDNLSTMPDWLSDALARLATGAGFSTRQLYSDSDEFSFSAARPVMLNGIGEVISRSDLLDRAVLVDLQAIPETERKLEADFWADFDLARPRILGALLDAVATAIARETSITMTSWPRMADFARWVTAAEPGLGWPEGSFLASYYANRGSANEMALEADPIAAAVISLLNTTSKWEGTPSQLLDKLAVLAGEQAAKRKDWPAAPNRLTNRLERLAPNLRAIGIDFERAKGTGGRRVIRLMKRGDEPGDLYMQTEDIESSDSAASNGRTPSPPSPLPPPPRSPAPAQSGGSGGSGGPLQSSDNDPTDEAEATFADLGGEWFS